MLDVSTTVKRFAMALLGTSLLLVGTPLLGVTPASAVDPGAATISIVNNPINIMSSRYNGTSWNIRLVARTTEPDANHDRITKVVFSASENNQQPYVVDTDYSAPFTADWNIMSKLNSEASNPVGVRIWAEAYGAAGQGLGFDMQSFGGRTTSSR